MKQIQNKQFNEQDSTASLLGVCLNSAGREGLDFATIRSRIKVADALVGKKPGDTIELEDADFAAAVSAISATRWVRPEKHLIEFAQLFGL